MKFLLHDDINYFLEWYVLIQWILITMQLVNRIYIIYVVLTIATKFASFAFTSPKHKSNHNIVSSEKHFFLLFLSFFSVTCEFCAVDQIRCQYTYCTYSVDRVFYYRFFCLQVMLHTLRGQVQLNWSFLLKVLHGKCLFWKLWIVRKKKVARISVDFTMKL